MHELSASACWHRPATRGKVLYLRIEYVEDQSPRVRQMLPDSAERVQLILDSEVVKECAIRNRDKREAPIHGEISHITFDDLQMALYMRR